MSELFLFDCRDSDLLRKYQFDLFQVLSELIFDQGDHHPGIPFLPGRVAVKCYVCIVIYLDHFIRSAISFSKTKFLLFPNFLFSGN